MLLFDCEVVGFYLSMKQHKLWGHSFFVLHETRYRCAIIKDDEEFASELTKMSNLYLVSNPALIEIEFGERKPGFKVLMYHGASMHSWIDELEDLRLENLIEWET
jgi:hypothetical protein